MTQLHPGSCSPQALRRMQTIFDAVWLELERRRSPLTFPWAVEATRFTIARLVLGHVNALDDVERVKREVLQSITNSGTRSPYHHGANFETSADRSAPLSRQINSAQSEGAGHE